MLKWLGKNLWMLKRSKSLKMFNKMGKRKEEREILKSMLLLFSKNAM
jgi:hypothetical protein